MFNIGTAQQLLKSYELSRQHLSQSYALAYKIDDFLTQGKASGSIGHLEKELREYDKALTYHQKALKLYIKANSEQSIVESYKDIGGIYYWLSNNL